MQTLFTLSLFDGVGDTRPKQIERTWASLCAKFAKPAMRQEKDGLLFSPAKYRAPRRLIANVIELSLLVLEVDGAWRCEGAGGLLGDCGQKGPLVMFRNARREKDHCPRCKQEVTIRQIHFNLESLTAAVRHAFPSAFALYSTHSHKRSTHSNALGEPRFRIVIPLSEPVPVADFLELWYAAVESLKEIPADPQVKDPNRIYYTPVKFSDDAPYEYHIEPGEPLDWKKFLMSPAAERASVATTEPKALASEARAGVGSPMQNASTAPAPSAVLSSGDAGPPPRGQPRWGAGIYSSYEARHEELCRRIVVRGKQNTRGNYDARCLAHGGKGTTAILYNPRSGAVACNRKCTYQELLVAEGLDDRKLPSKSTVNSRQSTGGGSGQEFSTYLTGTGAAASPMGSGNNGRLSPVAGHQPVLTLARLHVINALLLAHLFELTPEDEATVRRYWGDPFSEEIEWPGTDNKRRIKVCSFPTLRLQLEAVKRLSQEFDLEGTPGFYRLFKAVPGPAREGLDELVERYGHFRVALDQLRMRPGALLAPYDNGSGYICGIRIFRNIRDKCPFLLTSRGLPGGGKAVGYMEESAA